MCQCIFYITQVLISRLGYTQFPLSTLTVPKSRLLPLSTASIFALSLSLSMDTHPCKFLFFFMNLMFSLLFMFLCVCFVFQIWFLVSPRII